MARSWHFRVSPWPFVVVPRIADLPFWFAVDRRIGLGDFPKLRTSV